VDRLARAAEDDREARCAGPGWYDVPLRVRYAETDAQGVVYHANYLVYMEVARSAFTRSRGLPYQQLEARGINLVVAEAKLRYKASAAYDDPLLVRLRVKEVRGKIVRFVYCIEHEETRRLLVTGETTHVCVDPDFKPMDVPAEVAALFAAPPAKERGAGWGRGPPPPRAWYNPRMPGTRCIAAGYARLPTTTAAGQVYQTVAIVALVDRTTDLIEKASVTLVTPTAREFVEDLLVGSNLVAEQERILEELRCNYGGGAQKAVKQAYRDLCERYAEMKQGGGSSRE
jgi:acyl-CoA thioester hydrolase